MGVIGPKTTAAIWRSMAAHGRLQCVLVLRAEKADKSVSFLFFVLESTIRFSNIIIGKEPLYQLYPPKVQQLWRGSGGGGVLAGTRRQSAAGDGMPPSLQIPPHTHILLARSPAPYSPFRRRTNSPTAFSGPMARPPPSPPRPPPSHIHAGWMVSATKTPTSSAPSQDCPF